MADEFIHKDVGATLTEAEYDGIGAHVFDSQAQGDMLIATSATQLSRLGITNDRILVSSGGLFSWSNTLPAFTLGGALDANGQRITGDISSSTGLGVTFWSNAGGSGGAQIVFQHDSATPAVNDNVGGMKFSGRDAALADFNYGTFQVTVDNIGVGTEGGTFEWYGSTAGAQATNLAMSLTGAGGLGVDADIGTADDPVALFDEYDDALALRQGIQQRNVGLLADMGVFTKKDTGSGYMMNIQPMTRLLAGGVYQNRSRIDDLVDVIVTEFPQVAERLVERNLLS